MENQELSAEPVYPVFPQGLPDPLPDAGKYRVRFVTTLAELDAVQKLRFEVFNLELGEGLEESYQTGRDQDRFDPFCHHLIVENRKTDELVGTYRIQTGEMAARFGGFYSAEEFDLRGLPPHVMEHAVEVGRASVARDDRNRFVLFLLWKGLAAYMSRNRKRYLFGCCSLTGQDPAEGHRVMRFLEREGHVHPHYRTPPHPDWRCVAPTDGDPHPDEPSIKLPPLFNIYMRYGAKVCSAPALDRFFKTIDYLVLMDVEALDDESRALFFG